MRKGNSAFTLIELLTVIAIIAILAGIIVPVYGRAKDNANRSSDMSDMNSIRVALGVYREDQGAYPPQLLGYVTLYTSGPNMGNVVPATEAKGYVYPTRVQGIPALNPVHARFGAADVTNAVFPSADATAVGTTPILDLNGDGAVSAADDTAGSRQAYGPADGSVCWDPSVNAVVAGAARCGGVALTDPADPLARVFYQVSGYDVSTVATPGGNETQLRYARFWSNFAIGTGAGYGSGSEFDDTRQLGYSNPPDNTVVTWNSYYREFSSPGVPQAIRRDIVLYLGGSARPYDSKALSDFAWRQRN